MTSHLDHSPAANIQPSLNGRTGSVPVRRDREALHRIWQEHRRWIAAVLLAHKPRHIDLEDLLQEVAMTLVAKIHTLRDESNVRAWLRVIAINAARAAGRSVQARSTVALVDPHQELISPGNEFDRIEAGEHSRRVLNCISHLPIEYREPLMLKAVRGMRSRQIAQTLGIQEATVDTRISRARKMLRQLLQHSLETCNQSEVAYE